MSKEPLTLVITMQLPNDDAKIADSIYEWLSQAKTACATFGIPFTATINGKAIEFVPVFLKTTKPS